MSKKKKHIENKEKNEQDVERANSEFVVLEKTAPVLGGGIFWILVVLISLMVAVLTVVSSVNPRMVSRQPILSMSAHQETDSTPKQTCPKCEKTDCKICEDKLSVSEAEKNLLREKNQLLEEKVGQLSQISKNEKDRLVQISKMISLMQSGKPFEKELERVSKMPISGSFVEVLVRDFAPYARTGIATVFDIRKMFDVQRIALLGMQKQQKMDKNISSTPRWLFEIERYVVSSFSIKRVVGGKKSDLAETETLAKAEQEISNLNLKNALELLESLPEDSRKIMLPLIQKIKTRILLDDVLGQI